VRLDGRRPEAAGERYARYAAAIAGERLPVALVDLDAFEQNVDRALTSLAAAGAKTLRIATKSIRCPDLVARAAARGQERVRGVLAVSAPEAAWLVEHGVEDVLIGYPSAQAVDAKLVAEANAKARVMPAVDAAEHVELLSAAALEAKTTVPVVVDADVSLRALGGRVHLGARRSPLVHPAAVASLAAKIARAPGLAFAGVLAYEAQVAGVADGDASAPWTARARRLVRRGLEADARTRRAAIVAELARAGLHPNLFNGGGSGSLAWSAADPSLTEIAVGSAFLGSHLFDGYLDLGSEPALAFALQASRRPSPSFVTCLGGGFIASGSAGPDRLPRPWLPEGLALTPLEGAGEVQTPLRGEPGSSARLDGPRTRTRVLDVRLGAPIFFRPAKAGELAEHFDTYLLVRGDRIEARAKTYRGLGVSLL
jgi:D-serine deaminase-like pyridoxal phosphate-dependent protein